LKISCFFLTLTIESNAISPMNSVYAFLSKWKNLLLLFCLFILANVLLGRFMPKDHALDLMFAYSADEAYASLEQLNAEQQKLYSFGLLALDMPYLFIYGLLFSGILMKLWKKKFTTWIPVSIMIMDFFENILILNILHLLPERHDGLATLTSIFTTFKWILIGVLAISVIAGLFSLTISRFFSKESSVKTSN
jgi:hypothetical protein